MVLGDSAAAGVGVEYQSQAVSGQICAHLRSELTVHWELIARSRATTFETIQRLEKIPSKKIDAVVTSLGVNDVTSGLSVKKWRKYQHALFQLLQRKFFVSVIIFSPIPPIHAFPLLPQPLRWYLGNQAKRFNRIIKTWSNTRKDLIFLKIDVANDQSLMAADGFHPGPAFYAQWGKAAARSIIDHWKMITVGKSHPMKTEQGG
jgi:lysophospholipase L1-like esterase